MQGLVVAGPKRRTEKSWVLEGIHRGKEDEGRRKGTSQKRMEEKSGREKEEIDREQG